MLIASGFLIYLAVGTLIFMLHIRKQAMALARMESEIYRPNEPTPGSHERMALVQQALFRGFPPEVIATFYLLSWPLLPIGLLMRPLASCVVRSSLVREHRKGN